MLLGETGKFLVVTPDRFSEIDVGENKLSVTVNGASEESVRVELVAPHTMARSQMELSTTLETLKVDCSLSTTGSAQLWCDDSKCACTAMLE